MPKSKKEHLEKDALRASRIEQVISQNGWQDILAVIQAKYDSLMNDVLEKDNPEARGGIKTLIEVMDNISQDLEFGRNARNKYKKLYLTKTE